MNGFPALPGRELDTWRAIGPLARPARAYNGHERAGRALRTRYAPAEIAPTTVGTPARPVSHGEEVASRATTHNRLSVTHGAHARAGHAACERE